jgi:hypothetical protein
MVDAITSVALDDLLYEASQQDSTLVATSGDSTSPKIQTEAKNREAVQQANPGRKSQSGLRTAPIPFPASGRGRGDRATPHDRNQSRPGLEWSSAITQREP